MEGGRVATAGEIGQSEQPAAIARIGEARHGSMLKEYGRKLTRIWMTLDVALSAAIFVALLLQPALRRADAMVELDLGTAVVLGLGAGLGWPALLNRAGVYRWNRRQAVGGLVARLAVVSLIGALVLASVAFTLSAPIAPLFPVLLAATLFVVQVAIRVPVHLFLRHMRRRGRNFRNVLIIGAGPRARDAKETIDRHPEWGLRISGYIDDGEGDFVPSVPVEEIQKLIDLPMILRSRTVDEVLVACPRRLINSIGAVVQECALIGVPVTMLTDLFGTELPRPRVGSFDQRGTLSFAPVHHDDFALALKRGIDIIGGVLGLVISIPIMAVAAIAIKATSPGPVLFFQTRCGLNGRHFRFPKLRTMCVDAEALQADLQDRNEMDGPVFKIRRDPRVTSVGRLLRKLSLDELPQFWCVLRGDMSLVGPRPPIPAEVVQYQGSERRRLSMRPGLTCLWQIRGRSNISFDEWMQLDLEYIDSWSIGQDVVILLKTLPQVLIARGSS